MSPDLKEMIEKARQGDEQAMQELLQRFRPTIMSCSRKADYETDDAAQDLQEVLIKIFKRFNCFPSREE